MSDGRMREGVWLVHGELDEAVLRARMATLRPPLRLVTPSGIESDSSGWGRLVRDEVAAARADTTSARALLARVAGDRFLVTVVTAPSLRPVAVLRWLLDPAAPFPADRDGEAAANVPFPNEYGDAPAALVRESSSSGSAVTVYRPAAALAARLQSAGAPATAALAAGVAVLLHRYGGPATSTLVVDGPVPVAVGLHVAEQEHTGEFVHRVAKAIADGSPVHPLTRAAIAVAPPGPAAPDMIGAHRVQPLLPPGGVAHHELLVLLDGDRLRIDHDAGLYGQETVESFADRLLAVLDSIVDGTPVRSVTGLTERERIEVDRWSRGARRPIEEVGLHSLVARAAARSPDTPAVCCGDTELTYRELDAAADRTASMLRAHGVTAGDRVGLLAARTANSVVAMLGVLKAGAAFVPIDPAFPPGRVRHILLDSGARLLLAHRPPDPAPPMPVLPFTAPTGTTSDLVDGCVSPDDVAYVVYTSGSTGAPKGIAVHHRAIVASTIARQADTVAPDRDLVLPALCFDGAFGGLFWALTTGGTAVLPTDAEVRDAAALADLLDSAKVTHIHAVPSQYDLVLRVATPDARARLQAVSLGGEPLPPRLVARHLLDCPDTTLFNDYGPTECAVWATTQRCGLTEATSGAVPIGGPVANYRVHVLDPLLRPVPPGVVGEVYLGGPGVALGYHGKPALTAERFLPDPVEPDARLYRTGDRGQWSPEGRLRIIGRADDQVKLRGFRIELHEVTAAVRAHPAVADCAVLLRGEAGAERLDAFVEPRADLTETDLHRAVAAVLPHYMRPDRFTLLPELPRTPGGKLDMQALRGPTTSGIDR